MHNLQEVLQEVSDNLENDLYEPPEGEEEQSEGEEQVKKRSMRAAINLMCRECIYDDCSPGNWRQQVTGCAVMSCPLYEFRPYSKPRAKTLA